MKRYNITKLEGEWVKWEETKQVIDALEAKIDALMLEFCPDEMTPKQIKNWERCQRLSEMTEANING